MLGEKQAHLKVLEWLGSGEILEGNNEIFKRYVVDNEHYTILMLYELLEWYYLDKRSKSINRVNGSHIV